MNLLAEAPAPPRAKSPADDRPACVAAGGRLHLLLTEAARRRATHVHVEMLADGARTTQRVGGQVVEGATLSVADLAAILAELHSVAGFSANSGRAQRCSLEWSGGNVAVATLPTAHGDSLVLRLDAGERRDPNLEALGMRAALVAALRPALSRGGLVLVAGPAHSGRSTTLRALLNHAAGKARRPMLVEQTPGEPVAGAPGITLTADCAMADALRGAVHHDADIVMADSIEDRSSAAAAVEAAQAGLLVLGSIPAANAVGAIRRMREWRVEAFQLASVLNAVLAQRLVRRLCAECREPVQAQGSVSALLGFDRGAIVYSPHGCAACGDSGYAGQIAVFEAIHADPAIRRLINDGGDEAILARHAYVRAPDLGSAARALVREGRTTPEEAVRISRG